MPVSTSSNVKTAAPLVIKGQQPASKALPAASSKDLEQFSEKEKEILVSRAYEFLFDQKPIDPVVIRSYPDLKRFGNEVVLEAFLPNGTNVVRKGYGGNLLANVTQAARIMPRPVLQANPSAYFELTISPLKLICWGKPVQWVEVLEGRYYLPTETISEKFVFNKWQENQRFFDQYWKHLKDLLESAPGRTASSMLSTLALLHTTPPFQISIKDGVSILKERAFTHVKDFDPELSYAALPDGRMDVEGTASLLLLILADQERANTTYPFKRLAASLRFIQNEDGSFQQGLREEELIPKGDLRVPLILMTYYAMYRQGESEFFERFKRSFSYYFPANFNIPDEAAERLAWGRLLLGLGDKPEELAYENYLKGILDWFFQNIVSPDRTSRVLAGSFSEKVSKEGAVSQFEIYQLLTEGYLHFKNLGTSKLPETWGLKLFFSIRHFLNLQINQSDVLVGSFNSADMGGFSTPTQQLASFSDQLWSTKALTDMLRVWGAAEWDALKEKAEALL